jgi:hypothetical protein
MCLLKLFVFSRKLYHWFLVIILAYTAVSMGAARIKRDPVDVKQDSMDIRRTSMGAHPGIGVSVSAGSRFTVGGRLKWAFDNQVIPQPVFSLTGTPVAKKRLHRIGELEYIQLREKNMFFDLGLLEQFLMTRDVGLEAEASFRIVTGWYRGTERKYPSAISPNISVGLFLGNTEFIKTILRFQWFRIENSNFFMGTFIFEVW